MEKMTKEDSIQEAERKLSEMLHGMLEKKEISKSELFAFRLNMEKMVFSMLIDQYDNLENIADCAEAILSVPTFTPEEEREQDKRFHFMLIEATGNQLLISLMKPTGILFASMIDSIRDVSDVTMKEKLRFAHRNMVDALRSGSKQKCDRAVELHYQVVDEVVKKMQLKEYMGKRSYQYDSKRGEGLDVDPLTGLYVKNIFFQRADKYIREHSDEKLLLWSSDVQGLRFINEKYGTDIGDQVLQVVADKGRKVPGFLFGGRIGGDKFCMLRQDVGTDFRLLNEVLMEEYDIAFPVPNVAVKHGVYHIDRDAELGSHAMYGRSVIALQSIKDSYTTVVAEYDDHMRDELLLSRQLEEDAKEAMENGQFCVYLQPKVDIGQNSVSGAEALVRWIHPTLGFMNPGLFIPLFEKNGFMAKLDFWIWERVCQIICDWKERNFPIVPVSVNVSRISFRNPNLAEKIIGMVDKYGIDHSLFEIEITEYSCLENFDQIQKTIKILHDAGFVISLDDFGTGYSSMVVLSKIEIDVMKLDMSLIRNDNEQDRRSALEFALQLAQMMQFKTVAEGIETEKQVERIRSLGGDYVQGYFYSKPLPKNEFEEYMVNMDNKMN